MGAAFLSSQLVCAAKRPGHRSSRSFAVFDGVRGRGLAIRRLPAADCSRVDSCRVAPCATSNADQRGLERQPGVLSPGARPGSFLGRGRARLRKSFCTKRLCDCLGFLPTYVFGSQPSYLATGGGPIAQDMSCVRSNHRIRPTSCAGSQFTYKTPRRVLSQEWISAVCFYQQRCECTTYSC